MCIVEIYRVLFFQAEDGIRDLVRSRGLGDVYKRQKVCNVKFLYRNSVVHPAKKCGEEFPIGTRSSDILSLIHI